MKKIKIENLEKEIEYVKEDNELKGISYDGVSTSPTNEVKSIVESTVLGNLEKIEYLEHLIKRHRIDIDKLDKAMEELEEVEQTILRERYTNSKLWWQVAGMVRYGERHCKRLRTIAVNKLVDGIYGEK